LLCPGWDLVLIARSRLVNARFRMCKPQLKAFARASLLVPDAEQVIMCADNYLPHEYPNEPRLRDLSRTLWNWPRLLLLALIRLYQMTLSKSMPPNTCRFYPSCSHYGYQAIYKYGALKGSSWRRGVCCAVTRLIRAGLTQSLSQYTLPRT